MYANELRVGNLVLHNGNYVSIPNGEWIDLWAFDAQPIPLTPELFTACGFEVYGLSAIRKGMLFTSIGEGEYEFHDYRSCHIKYVHQLQNLYFSLTGKELEIKL